MYHFDFYRLNEPGVVAAELAEVEGDDDIVVAVEWGEIVHTVLPDSRILVTIKATSENDRSITFEYPSTYTYLFKNVTKV